MTEETPMRDKTDYEPPVQNQTYRRHRSEMYYADRYFDTDLMLENVQDDRQLEDMEEKLE